MNMTHLFCIDYKFYFLFEICSLFDIFQIYSTIYKVDNIIQLLAFCITYMTSINLICYFIKFSSLYLLNIIFHMDIMYRAQFSYT